MKKPQDHEPKKHLNTTPRDIPDELGLQFRQTISEADQDKYGVPTAVMACLQHGLRQIEATGGDLARFEARVTRQVSKLILVEIIAGMDD